MNTVIMTASERFPANEPIAAPLVELFDLNLAKAPIVDQPLAEWQREAHQAAHYQHGVAISIADSVFASRAFIDKFAARTAALGTPTCAATEIGRVHQEFGTNPFGAEQLGDQLHYRISAMPTNTDPAADSTPICVAFADQVSERPQPGRMANPILAAQSDCLVWGIGHWVDLLIVNLLALQAQIRVQAAEQPEPDGNCTIHPSAIIERSKIGHGVQIGPLAVVRDSILADGVSVEEHASISGSYLGVGSVVQSAALVTGSVVGDHTVLSFQTATRGSLLLGHSTISAPVVARSLIGRNVFLARGVRISASTLNDTTIRVRRGSRSVDSGMHLLGCAVGSGARIGGGVELPPGYEVAPERYLVERPIPRLPTDSPRRAPLAVVDGRFRQLGFTTRSQS